MVAIAPFRALRYNRPPGEDLSRVIAPPYDVISPEEQAQLYDRSPENVVRLIFGTQHPDDTDTNNRYTRAKQAFDRWRAEGVLKRDEAPAVYLVEHAFRWQGRALTRVGVIALLQFEGAATDQVVPHEATFGAPKADRTRLLDAVQAHLSPIFCVLPDPEGRVRAWWQRLMSSAPPAATATVHEERLRWWVVSDSAAIQSLQHEAAPRCVLIADGHHRFEVAWSRRDRCPGVMTYFACLEDPALVVSPIHRVVAVPPEALAAWQAHRESVCDLAPASSRDEVQAWLGSVEGQGRFGYYEAGRWFRASLRREVLAEWLLHPSVALPLAGLDVSMLHEVILKPLLVGHPSADALCRFTPDIAQATAVVDRLTDGHAWWLRPIPLTQIFALASHHIRMPQKTTYFYPKIYSGLCINPFEQVPDPVAR